MVSIIPNDLFPKELQPIGVVVVNQKESFSSFDSVNAGLEVCQKLRKKNLSILHSNFEGRVSNQLQKLTSSCKFVVIVGEEEWKKGKITVKNLVNGEQETTTLDECVFE